MAMAPGGTMVFSVRPTAVRPCAAASAAGGAGARGRADGPAGKWWAPVLGWSGQPDYIDARPAATTTQGQEQERPATTRRFGVLTEDKARQLRMRMMETESFHDAMYHSAIASRLASAAPPNDGVAH